MNQSPFNTRNMAGFDPANFETVKAMSLSEIERLYPKAVVWELQARKPLSDRRQHEALVRVKVVDYTRLETMLRDQGARA